MASKPQDTYSTVFDFVFSTRKKVKKGADKKEIGMKMPAVSGLGEAFAEIAMHPALYPVEQLGDAIGGAFNEAVFIDVKDIAGKGDFEDEYESDHVGGLSAIDNLRFRVRGNEMSSFLNNPRGYIDKVVDKYKKGRKWAMFGNVTRSLTAAQMGLWSHQALKGVITDKEERAMFAGMVTEAMNGGRRFFRSDLFDDDRALQKTRSFITEDVIDTDKGITRDKVDKAVERAELLEDKSQRLEATRDYLINSGVNSSGARRISERFWGKEGDSESLGLYGEKVRETTKEELLKQLEQRRSETTDPEAMRKIGKLMQAVKEMDGSWGMGGGGFVLGQFIGKAGFTMKWFQENIAQGGAFQAAVNGDMFSAGLGHKVFRTVREKKFDIVDSDGNTLEEKAISMFVPTDLLQGKVFGALQYFHPANIAKGALIDGRHYLKLAQMMSKGSGINTKNFFYKLHQIMPANVLGRMKGKITAKALEKARLALANYIKNKGGQIAARLGVQSLAKLPLNTLIKKAVSTLLTQVLGLAVPVAGNIAAIVVDVAIFLGSFFMDKLIKPIMEAIALLFLGIIALVFLGVGSVMGLFQTTSRLNRHLNPPYADSGMPVPPDIDWNNEPIPDNYSGRCPAPGVRLRCTQGSSGAVSSYHQNTRAVDFGLVAGTPILAPNDGVIQRAQSSSNCSDGTNYGGTIVFKEDTNADGSGGYVWYFLHVRPAVSSGQRLEIGDLIGRIDGPSTADYSDQCWTGPHLHTHVTDSGGAYLDSEVVLKEVGCRFNCN